ncbi:hypothetical protein CRE_09315 [Caenorhabditis remanei]|uniref:T20D4.11-like domain-containing protein n=1 Tax=Caenorhabditis remanei TaxID=31234 RepID=E3LI41_CAERE|nr:hypothetical protein CRE_09315 [Caenorhabditis remanei]
MFLALVCLFHVVSIQASDNILSDYVFSKDCDPKESVLSLGMCTRYINQLRLAIDETPSVNTSIDKMNSVLNTCHSVVVGDFLRNTNYYMNFQKCYNGSECADVKKNAVTFQEKCLFLEFEYFGVTDCMSDFYKEVYEPNNKCTEDFDWFSKDMEVRKDAYTSGKSCFMSFVNNNCSAKTNEYIDSDYNHFVKIMTVDSTPNTCESLHDEMNGKQCSPLITKYFEQVEKYKSAKALNQSVKVNLTPVCLKAKKCWNEQCIYRADTTNTMEKLCEAAADLSKPTTFDECFVFVKTSTPAAEYECTQQSKPKRRINPGPDLILSPYVLLPHFLNDKDCVKTMMEGECDQSALKSFEEDWKRTWNEKDAIRDKLDIIVNTP